MTSIWERIQDWVLLFALLIVSVGVMLAQNEPLVRALRATSLETTARIENALAWMGNYFRALEENSRLRAENIELASEVARSREARIENLRLERMLGLKDTSDYRLKAARIVSKDITRQRNLFTINVGAQDSVEVGMPVVNERGILGKVVLVSQNYSRVMPYLNTDFRVPARIQPLQAEGIVRWEGERSDRLLMEHVVKSEPVLRGHLVVTSGSSGVFPSGLSVGYVDSVATLPGRNEHRILLQPTAPLDNAQYAFVIMHTPDGELVSLNQEDIR